MRNVSCIALILFYFLQECSSQFTDVEIRNLRRRAVDSGFSLSEFEALERQITESLNLRRSLHELKMKNPLERERIEDLSLSLREKFRELLTQTNPMANHRGTSAAERAIERLHRRRAIKQAEEEKLRLEREQLDYIANTRKLQLVDESIRSLKARGEAYELRFEGWCDHVCERIACISILCVDMKHLNFLLESYRAVEASSIFNNTSVKVSTPCHILCGYAELAHFPLCPVY